MTITLEWDGLLELKLGVNVGLIHYITSLKWTWSHLGVVYSVSNFSTQKKTLNLQLIQWARNIEYGTACQFIGRRRRYIILTRTVPAHTAWKKDRAKKPNQPVPPCLAPVTRHPGAPDRAVECNKRNPRLQQATVRSPAYPAKNRHKIDTWFFLN